jgi:uncharacterized YigZ family protein
LSDQITKYRTLERLSTGFLNEKNSKFIAIATPCYSLIEAKDFIHSWKKEHPQANHFCFAYKVGIQNCQIRINDDGEPTNSAGLPIFGQIQSYELNNVLIGVIRYFGGTKLGVGGLIKAYKNAAKDAIVNGLIIEKEIYRSIMCSFDYSQIPLVMNLVKKFNLDFTDQVFNENCSIKLQVPFAKVETVMGMLNSIENIEIINLGTF